MGLKISNNSLLSKNYLTVDSGGVQFYDSAGFSITSGGKRFPFDKIACVLMSADNKLSFQVDNEVFSIEVNPDDAVHKTVINALLQEVRRTTS